MIECNNSLDNANDFTSPEGERYAVIYSPKVCKDGSIELIESGKKDIRQEINAWRDHTDMSYVLAAMNAGMYPPRDDLMYGDFTDTPSSMIEAMQIMLNAENAFYSLDLDTRRKFDSDYKKWLAMLHSDPDKFSELMGFSETAIPADPVGKESDE